MPKLSILMPVYNAAPYLDAAVGSILAQTFKDFELICQDDGSTDDSLAVLERLAKGDKRIRILPGYGGNKGVIVARNALLSAATGTYTGWMDADDISEPTKFKTQIAFLDKNKQFVAVGTAILLTDERMHPQKVQTFDPNPERQAIDPEICCATVVARTSAVRAAGPMRDIYRPGGEDGDWCMRLADHGAVTNLDEPLYQYRQHASNTSQYFAPIRRLGVLARMSARVRRETGVEPIDAFAFDAAHTYLEDDVFLSEPNLTPLERTLALSMPLRGRKPFASILIYFQDDHYEVFECLRTIRRQDFQNHEIIIYDDGSKIPLDVSGLHTEGLTMDTRILRSETIVGPDAAFKEMAKLSEGRLLFSQFAADFMREDRLNHQLRFMLGNPDVQGTSACVNKVDENSHVYHSEFYPTAPTLPSEFQGEARAAAIWARSPFGDIKPVKAARTKKSTTSAKSDAAPTAQKDALPLALLSVLPQNSLVQTMPDILYYLRKPRSVATSPLATGAAKNAPQIPYHDLYYRMRGEFGLLGLSVTGDHAQDDQFGLRQTVWKLEPILRPISDSGQLGEALTHVSFLEWRQGKRGLLGLLGSWSARPKSALKFLRSRTARKIAATYETAREALAPIIPRGGILGGRSPIGRLLGRQTPLTTIEPTKTRVVVYDGWGDLPDALDHLLPMRRRSWRGVEFIPAAEVETRKVPVDYALILNHVGNRPVKLELPPNRIWFALGEPPTPTHRELQLGSGLQSTILTPDETLPALSKPGGRHYEHTLCMTRTWSVKRTVDQLEALKRPLKTKKLSWITSNLALLAGHRYRLAFLEKIREELPLTLFGRGFAPIADKWDGIAPFQYSIAFENTIANGYVTEKLFDCWVAGAMPFYFGAPDVEKHFPPEALVRIDPEDPHVVAKMLEVCESDLWQERAAAIEEAKHLVLKKHNMFMQIAERIASDETAPAEPVPQWFYPVDVRFS